MGATGPGSALARGDELGAETTALSPELRHYFGAPVDAGVLVASIEPASVAERAGLRVGDILVEVRGTSRVIATTELDDGGGRWLPTALVVLRHKKWLVLAIAPSLQLRAQRSYAPPRGERMQHELKAMPDSSPLQLHPLRDLKDPFANQR